MTRPVQDELKAIFEMASATTMDVERKHAHDKRNEHSRLITVARASRNTILRRYRQTVADSRQEAQKVKKNIRKSRSVSATALALREKPEMASRRNNKVHIDQAAMKAYMANHGDRLRTEAAAIRAQAQVPTAVNLFV